MASASWYSINFSCSVSDSDALKEVQADEKIAEGTLDFIVSNPPIGCY